jgi:signal transduction histidine kinase
VIHRIEPRECEALKLATGEQDNNPASAAIWCALAGQPTCMDERNADGWIEPIPGKSSSPEHTEAQLCHSQRMEALGVLTVQAAHDLNNLLTVILGYADLIQADDAPAGPTARKINQIIKAAERATVLTRRILDIGRGRAVPQIDEEHKRV